jgi:NADH dehydrogenase
MRRRVVITGAFSNTGRALAEALLLRNWSVGTLTNRPAPEGAPPIDVFPLRFDRASLVGSLRGADVLVNTYWIRFPCGGQDFGTAVRNSGTLISAARAAGIARLVQVTVSNPSLGSTLGYYRGKAEVEDIASGSGLSYAIARPTLVVGPRDVLTNNMCWFVRRFPVTAVPLGGAYRLQPVTIGDLARLLADAVESEEPRSLFDVAGPEVFTFREYLALLARVHGRRFRPVPLPPRVLIAALGVAGRFLRDTVLTKEELEALRRDLLVSKQTPLGRESVSGWLLEHGASLGRCYVNDTLPRFGSALARRLQA